MLQAQLLADWHLKAHFHFQKLLCAMHADALSRLQDLSTVGCLPHLWGEGGGGGGCALGR